jgi:hypothetical protein
MHYSNLVIVRPEDHKSIDEAVEHAMGPHEEDGGFWDWYQIGGRWTGALDGYDPDKDPANRYKCELCGGTGKRDDEIGREHRKRDTEYGCNGCDGTGTAVRWPTGWARHDGDIMPIANLTEEHLERFYRIITPYGRYDKERWQPWNVEKGEKSFVEQEMPPLKWLKEEFKDCVCVVVDNHS